jgi:hypothetical protein
MMIWERIEQLDRRQRSHRFGLAAPASFSWLSPDGEQHHGEGITRDIGADGVYMYAHHTPIAGTVVEVNVSFPSLDAGGVMVRLSGRGTVVRLDLAERDTLGFAAAVKFAVSPMPTTSCCTTRIH